MSVNDFFNKAVVGGAVIGGVVGKNMLESALGSPKVEVLRSKCKEKTKELSRLLVSNKEKLPKETFFKLKSKISTFESLITRLKSEKDLIVLEKDIKNVVEQLRYK